MKKIEPVEDKEVLALVKTAVTSSDPKESGKSMVALRALASDRVLGALAYALLKDECRQEVLYLMLSEFKDERLGPFLAQCIMKADGDVLLLAVTVAKGVKSRELLPALIERALKSEYGVTRSSGGMGGSVHFESDSVFANAAEALHQITDGKIGVKEYIRRKDPDTKEMQALTAKWNEWWQANKPKEKDGEKKALETPKE